MPLRAKNAPLRRSRTRHDQAPLEKSGRGAQSGGIRLARYTLRNHLPSFSREIWSFSFEARYTVTRITLFQFADTTSMSVPQFKDFPGARESASSPALTKINIPTAFAPRTHVLYHFPPPRVNRRAPLKLARKVRPSPTFKNNFFETTSALAHGRTRPCPSANFIGDRKTRAC